MEGASKGESGPGSGARERVLIRRELDLDRHRSEMAGDVREGLGSRPRTLPPKYFYDERGSRLFEAITRLPEYYQTRTERALLEEHAGELVGQLRPRALVEYGSGSAGKTAVLLEAMAGEGLLEGYAPIDVSPVPVREVAEELVERHPHLRVVGVIADFETPLELPFEDLPRLVLFLGSTIGNMPEADAVEFLARVAGQMTGDDAFLLGFDLVKDRDVLRSAYNDDAGVTAEFNRNVLRVLNRELDADFDLGAFRHRALWNEAETRIEMHLFATAPRTVTFGALDLEVEFEEGESIRTELSHKYTRETAGALLERAGLEVARWMTDPDDLFALALARLP